MSLSLRQEQALAIMPKIMSSCSIPCSFFIIYEVFCDHKTRGTTAVQRALVGMSIVDIMASSAWFLSTWAVPEGSFAFAAGNTATCNFQGFLLQLAIGAPLYNSSLALFYLLMIKSRWTDEQLVKIERFVHGFIIFFTIGTSILLLFLEQYNHIGAVCWVIGAPAGCGNSSYQPSDVPCERGDYAWAWGLALFYGPLWFCVVLCCSSMLVLYLEVRKTHRRSMRYSTVIGLNHTLNRSGSDSNRVAVQAMLYSLSFLITWMPSTLWSIAHWFNFYHYGLDIAAATAEPLQGFWNLLIFLKSRPKTVMKVQMALSKILPCIFSPPNDFDMRVSFATGLRANRTSASNLSAGLSSNHFVERGVDDSMKKPPHRNTASTEALDEFKSRDDSLNELIEDDTSASEDNQVKDTSRRSDRSYDLAASIPDPIPEAFNTDVSKHSCGRSSASSDSAVSYADEIDTEDNEIPITRSQTESLQPSDRSSASSADVASYEDEIDMEENEIRCINSQNDQTTGARSESRSLEEEAVAAASHAIAACQKETPPSPINVTRDFDT